MKQLKSLRPAIAILSLAGLGHTQGTVLYFEGVNIPIPADFTGVYLDLANPAAPESPASSESADNAGGSYLVTFGEPAGDWDFNFFLGGIGIAHSSSVNPYRIDPGNNLSAIQSLEAGDLIDGSTPASGGALPLLVPGFGGSGTGSGGGSGVSLSQSHIGSAPGQFLPGELGYLGFVLDPESGSPMYGWLSATFQEDGTPGMIHDIAYSDAPLEVSAVPEPGAIVLALIPLLALIRRRR